MLRDTTIDNNWWYTECQATYNIRSIDSSNAIIHFTRICASLVGGNIYPTISLLVSSFICCLWLIWGCCGEALKNSWWQYMRKSLFHWWLLSWLSLSPSSTWIFCVTGLIVQEQTLFIHLMDIAYIRQDRICIRGSHSPFNGYFY